MGLSRLFGLCASLLFASSVSAAVTIDLGPSDYRNWGTGSSAHASNGIRQSFGQTVRIPPANTSLVVTRNPVVPYGSIANGMRSFVRVNPASVAASAAITAIMLGLDWAFDEERDSWMKEGIETEPEFGDFYWYKRSDPSITAPAPAQLCVAITPGRVEETYVYRDYEFSHFVFESNGRNANCWYDVTYTPKNGQPPYLGPQQRVEISRAGSQCYPPAVYYPDLGVCGRPGLVPLTSSDWQELEASLPSTAPSLVGDAAGDIMARDGSPLPGYSDTTITGPSSVSGPETTSTSTDPVTGDTVVTTTQTTTNITYGDTTITTTNTTTSNTYTNGQHTGSEIITETPGELPVIDGGGAPPAGEWPGFCEWASIVCDWIGWTQEEAPAEPDLPQVIDDDFYEEKTIQFGSKSCPPDYEISVPFINSVVAVPMQPLCDFAGIIYYMVMAAAYIIAAYITIGVARNG